MEVRFSHIGDFVESAALKKSTSQKIVAEFEKQRVFHESGNQTNLSFTMNKIMSECHYLQLQKHGPILSI